MKYNGGSSNNTLSFGNGGIFFSSSFHVPLRPSSPTSRATRLGMQRRIENLVPVSTYVASEIKPTKAKGQCSLGLRMGAARAPSVRALFGDERATAAVLGFLESMRVGRMPGRILMAGGLDVEEGDLETIEMWAPEEEEGTGISESEEEDNPAPPPL